MASEVAYDVFFRILQRHDQISSPKHFLPYLLNTAKWRAFDILRREHRGMEKNISIDEFADTLLDSSILSPAEVLIQKEDEESHSTMFTAIKTAMNQLEELERTVIQQSLFDGINSSAVAKRNNISLHKFYGVRRRAVARLRKILAAGPKNTLSHMNML